MIYEGFQRAAKLTPFVGVKLHEQAGPCAFTSRGSDGEIVGCVREQVSENDRGVGGLRCVGAPQARQSESVLSYFSIGL